VRLRWEAGHRRPGIYFVRVTAPSVGYRAERKLVLLP
jgi:hypothetical protein